MPTHNSEPLESALCGCVTSSVKFSNSCELKYCLAWALLSHRVCSVSCINCVLTSSIPCNVECMVGRKPIFLLGNLPTVIMSQVGVW